MSDLLHLLPVATTCPGWRSCASLVRRCYCDFFGRKFI